MSKLRKLFDMTEHPERYQDSDWQQLAPGHDITDDDISRAWSRVLATENKMAADEHGGVRNALDMAADEHGGARNDKMAADEYGGVRNALDMAADEHGGARNDKMATDEHGAARNDKMAADEHGAARNDKMAADEYGGVRKEETVSVRVRPMQEKNHPLLKIATDEHGGARNALDMAADERGGTRKEETVSVRVSPMQEKNHPLLKIAAAVAAVMMLSGIAWAAFGGYFAKEKSPQETARTDLQHDSPSTAADTLLVPPYPRTPVPPKNVVFENVELQAILQKMTEHYRLEGVSYSRQELRHLRLYYEWDTSASLQAVLDELNAFEQIKISTDGKKLNVE